MSTRFGACVARARLHARFGRPIPTKTTSPSRSSLAARTAMSSEFVYVSPSEAVVDSFAKAWLRLEALAQTGHIVHVRGAIGDAVDEFVEPRLQPRVVARHLIPGDVVDDEAGDERPVRVGAHDRRLDDLLDDHDDALRRERRLFLDAVEAPDLRVTLG